MDCTCADTGKSKNLRCINKLKIQHVTVILSVRYKSTEGCEAFSSIFYSCKNTLNTLTLTAINEINLRRH